MYTHMTHIYYRYYDRFCFQKKDSFFFFLFFWSRILTLDELYQSITLKKKKEKEKEKRPYINIYVIKRFSC